MTSVNFLTAMDVPKRRDAAWIGFLMRDGKVISCVECPLSPPIKLPTTLHIKTYDRAAHNLYHTEQLPYFNLHQRGPPGRINEWQLLLDYLYSKQKVGCIFLDGWKLVIQPPRCPPCGLEPLCVRYCPSSIPPFVYIRPVKELPVGPDQHPPTITPPNIPYPSTRSSKPSDSVISEPSETTKLHPRTMTVHPKFLNSLEVTHTDWIFGGVAELIDNARDAGATRLDVSIEQVRWKSKKESIPMLQVVDNGHGMDHDEIVRMLSIGHESPDEDDSNQIGRFGVGFKTGAMRIGDNALVLTQSKLTRSLEFFSKSYNKGKDVLEVPIVTYQNYDGSMELDTSIQSEADEEACFSAIETHSPFDKFRMGSEFDKIGKGKTGTRIYVYDLKKWGLSDCVFKWRTGSGEKIEDIESGKCGDITIHNERVRNRPGQTSTEVPLDYSLRAYLEVMFLVPNMSVYVQGTRVRTVKLADSLHSTKRIHGTILDKPVELTLGFRHVEYERGNCGIFLYWHKRLIQAYKRVGRMVHSADYGRGVVGVMDITELMDFGAGEVGVLASKQGFKDCEQYVAVEDWLADKVHAYCDDKEKLEVLNFKKIAKGVRLKADQDWVQCDKCLQWRTLPVGMAANNLPAEWFCYMEPFKGKCQMPQEKLRKGIVTVGVKRLGTRAAKQSFADGSNLRASVHITEEVSDDSSIDISENTSMKLGKESSELQKLSQEKGKDNSGSSKVLRRSMPEPSTKPSTRSRTLTTKLLQRDPPCEPSESSKTKRTRRVDS